MAERACWIAASGTFEQLEESKTLATSKSPRWPSSPSSCKPALRFDCWPSETGGAACSRSHPLPHGCRPTSFAPVERVVGILNTTSSVAWGVRARGRAAEATTGDPCAPLASQIHQFWRWRRCRSRVAERQQTVLVRPGPLRTPIISPIKGDLIAHLPMLFCAPRQRDRRS